MDGSAVEHPRFRVIRAPSTKLAVFFTGSSEADGRFHFYGQARACGVNALLLNNGRNEWYQNGVPGLGDNLPSTIGAIRSLAHDLGAGEVYCIGSSMGGAGAVLYGSLLGAKALAFGFETRVGLEHSRSLKLGSCPFPIPDLTPSLGGVSHLNAYIGAGDPQDLFASAHLFGHPKVTMTALHGLQHGIPSYLKARDRLRPLIAAFLDDAPLPDMPEADPAVFTPGFPEALHEAHCGYWSGDLDRWERGGREAVRLHPGSDAAHYLLGRALLRKGDYAQALGIFAIARRLNPGRQDAHYYFAHTLRHLGLPRDALAIHALTARKWPDYALPWSDMALAWAALNNPARAAEAMEKAHAITPNQRWKARAARWRQATR